jgi:ABC-type multidrug transport system fused ATPase/permease subunit
MKFQKNIFQTLLMCYKPFLAKIIFIIVIGFLGRLILLANAQVIAQFLDVNPILTKDLLKQLIIKLAFFLGTAFLFTILYRTIFSRLSSLAVSRLYDETTFRVSRFPMSFFDKTPVGQISTRFSSDYGNVFRLFGGPLAEFLSLIFDLISIVIIMTLSHPYFLISLVLSGFCFQFILKLNQARLRINRREMSVLRGPSVAHFSETVQGSISIRQQNKQSIFQDRFAKLDQLFLTCKAVVSKNILSFSIQLNLMSTLLFVCHGLMCLYLYKQNRIGAAEITIVLGFTVLATSTLQMFFEWYSQFDEALIGVDRMDQYLRSPTEDGAYLPENSDFQTDHIKYSKNQMTKKIFTDVNQPWILNVNNLSFKYPGQNENTLTDIQFQIRPGEKLGIIGRTGSGKSTLISVLLRLYPIYKGCVQVQGYVEPDVEKHRSQFSVITQEQFFFKGTLRDNLDLFATYTDQVLEQIIEQTGLKMALGFIIAEKGQNLSQGEKQLISLARGLIKNSEIFIFDEATSNVDPHSEKLIQSALTTALSNKTQIRIAHRLQTVEDCDQILWLDHGQIKKYGPTQEVLEAFRGSS